MLRVKLLNHQLYNPRELLFSALNLRDSEAIVNEIIKLIIKSSQNMLIENILDSKKMPHIMTSMFD